MADFDQTASAVFPMTAYLPERAASLRVSVEELAESLLFEPRRLPVQVGKLKPKMCDWVPSGRLGDGLAGPRKRYRVVCVGKMPGRDECEAGRNFVGPAGAKLAECARGAGMSIDPWYSVNAVRYLSPDGGKTIRSAQLKDCGWLLGQDIALTRPEFLLLLGADAVRAVCGKDAKLAALRGHPYRFASVAEMGRMPVLHDGRPGGITVFTTVHPAALLYEGQLETGFRSDLGAFARLLGDGAEAFDPAHGLDLHWVESVAALRAVVDEVLSGGFTEVAVDCEWGGKFHNGLLRSIQFAWKEDCACGVGLLREGGHAFLDPAERAGMMSQLHRLFTAPGMKIVGQNFREDAKWLESEGLPVMERFSFDSLLAEHALAENAERGLEALALRYTNLGRYDLDVQAWLRDNNVTGDRLAERGYLDVPEEMLRKYAMLDVICTLRVARVQKKRLKESGNEGPCRNLRELVLPASAPILEAEMTGMLVDADMMGSLTDDCVEVRDELADKVREAFDVPGLNPRSYPKVCSLLFDPKSKGGLGLMPYKTTEKPPRMYEDLARYMDAEDLAALSPAVDAEALEYLAAEHPGVALLADFRTIDKLITGFIPSWMDLDGKAKEQLSRKSLSVNICRDGRIRTRFAQTTTTGRYTSSEPNLQNISNKREKDYERILGSRYRPLRSMFVASPGFVLVQGDYRSAEIVTLARLSGCTGLLRDSAFDLHSRVASSRFGAPKWAGYDDRALPPEAWKEEFNDLRTSAKALNFGVPYQLGAKSLARKIERDTKGKVKITPEQAQKLIDDYYAEYTEVGEYVDDCKEAVLDPGYVENPFGGRRRYLGDSEDEARVAAAGREFVNAPIQGVVAKLLDRSVANLFRYRKVYPGAPRYRLVNFVHDSTVAEVPADGVAEYVDRVLPACMVKGAVCPSWRFFRHRSPTKPFHLDVDIKVSLRWDQKSTPEELQAAGLSREDSQRFGKAPKPKK